MSNPEPLVVTVAAEAEGAAVVVVIGFIVVEVIGAIVVAIIGAARVIVFLDDFAG